MLSGHGGQRSRLSEATHDLMLTTAYLMQPCSRRERWSEQAGRTKRGVKKPDAIIDLPPRTAIEQGGESYTAAELKGLWEWCHEHGLGLELW
jgi:hypothetical protein